MLESNVHMAWMKMYVKLTEAENAKSGKVTKYRKPKVETNAYPVAAEHSAAYGHKK